MADSGLTGRKIVDKRGGMALMKVAVSDSVGIDVYACYPASPFYDRFIELEGHHPLVANAVTDHPHGLGKPYI